MYITSFNPHNDSVKDMSLFPLLKMRKLRCKEINSHIQGHTVGKWQNQDLNPRCQAIKTTVLVTKQQCLLCVGPELDYWKERLSLVKRGLKRETGFHLQT